MKDSYYRLVLARPIPWKLIEDLQLAPIQRRIRAGSVRRRYPLFVPRPRPEQGTVAQVRERHLRRLRSNGR